MLDSPKTHAYEAPNEASNAFDQPAETIRGVFEPPSGFVLLAISRHKVIVLLSVVVLALVGVGLGEMRKSTYSASATLQVGQVNPNSPGFYGYVQSSAALATAFSRAITSESVLSTVQHELKVAPSNAIARLSAEPLPQAPAFRVIATGPTEHAAVRLANVAANAVIGYESQTNSANPQAASLLTEYRAASVQLHRAINHVEHLRPSHITATSVLVRAEAEKDTAQITLRAIEAAYTAAVASQAPRTGLVTLLAGATSASSNSGSKVELLGFIGLLAGVFIGCVVAVLFERRRTSREVAAKMPMSEPA
jgi:uncharacterized protein involved in exopolysaccharide biosynthesis